MKTKEIRELNTSEMEKKLVLLREKQRSFRFGGAGSRSKNVKEGKALRQDIARILTVINDKLPLKRGKQDGK